MQRSATKQQTRGPMLDVESRRLGYLVSALFLVVGGACVILHGTFEEWDGAMQLFAGRELWQLGKYQGWSSHFWPPLYPLILGAGDALGNGFLVGKCVSLLAATVILQQVYMLAIERGVDEWLALAAQLLVAASPFFMRSAIQVENHMLDAMFIVLAFRAWTRADDLTTGRACWVGALLAGATLTRYTSYAVALVVLAAMAIDAKQRKTLRPLAAACLSFCALNSPWWIANSIHEGQPLATWQYLNIGSRVVGLPSHQWWWDAQADYSSVWDIIRAHPRAYAANWLGNLGRGLSNTLTTSGGAMVIIVFALFRSFTGERPRGLRLLVSTWVVYLAIAAQAFMFAEVTLAFVILFIPVGLSAAPSDLWNRRLGRALLVAMLGLGLFSSTKTMSTYLGDEDDGGQLSDLERVSEVLDAQPAGPVTSIHGTYAWATGRPFIVTPLFHRGSAVERLDPRTLSPRVRAYQPRYPSDLDPSGETLYLIVSPALRALAPELEELPGRVLLDTGQTLVVALSPTPSGVLGQPRP